MPLPPLESDTAERQTLDEIRDWYRGILDALIEQRANVQHAMTTGASLKPQFFGWTYTELDEYYDAQRRELDRLTAMNLVASMEATIRVDYARRVAEKLTDKLSLCYRAWHATLSEGKQALPDFDEAGILERLKEAHVMDNNIVGRYRECLRPRHWVGHGRYWAKHADVDRLVPDIVHARCAELMNALPP